MRVLGIEFESNRMNFVLLSGNRDAYNIEYKNRLQLGDTRSRESLVAFQNAVTTLYNSVRPDKIAIKSKPESGRLRAGAAALKMEGVVLANAPCEVTFVSGQIINQCTADNPDLLKYQLPAFRAAAVTIE